MRYTFVSTPAHLGWVEARPSSSGKGMNAYFDSFEKAAEILAVKRLGPKADATPLKREMDRLVHKVYGVTPV